MTTKLPSLGSDIGYYQIEKFSPGISSLTIDNFIMSFFSTYYDRFSDNNKTEGLMYCNMIREKETQLPEGFGIYARIGNDIFFEGQQITSCSDCVINNEIPHMLFDGERTFYKDILLSWFDYNNLVILSETDSIFTDKNNVYYQWILLEDMEWTTFEQPNKSIWLYRDKTYTYTIQAWRKIERIENIIPINEEN